MQSRTLESRLLQWLKVVVAASVAVFFGVLAWATWQAPGILRGGIAEVRADANRQAMETREALVAQVAVLTQEVGLYRADLKRLGDRLATVADRRIGEALTKVDTRLATFTAKWENVPGRLESLIATADASVAESKPVLANAAAITANVRSTLDYNLNCKSNGACWPAGITAALGGAKVTLGEAALTARHWRKETPAIASGVRETTQNVAKITRTGWYWKMAAIAGPVIGALIAAIR